MRATELARLSGRHKQIVGRLVDELEELGYVERRRARRTGAPSSSFPPIGGSTSSAAGTRTSAEIEARDAAAIGGRNYAAFRDVLRGVVARSREPSPAA